MINPSLKETISYEKFRAYAAIQNVINFLKLGAESDFVAKGTRLDLDTVLK